MIARDVNFPNIYGVPTVESLEMLFSLKNSHFNKNKKEPMVVRNLYDRFAIDRQRARPINLQTAL